MVKVKAEFTLPKGWTERAWRSAMKACNEACFIPNRLKTPDQDKETARRYDTRNSQPDSDDYRVLQ